MAARAPELPFLPGYTFNSNLGRTRYPMDPLFDFLGNKIICLKEKVKPGMLGPLSDRYPSIYGRGDVMELPAWIAFDKQILKFEGFFQETLQEMRLTPFLIRRVNIYFFLEDGTIQVVEPRTDNSGTPQGCVISRQRIRFPAPMDDNFYDIIDFNIGKEVELYGKVIKITGCDRFTRVFLNRLGIAVPDPLTIPEDPNDRLRKVEKDIMLPKKPNRKVDSLEKFLKYDKMILKFLGYWDDQETDFGILHHLEIYFFLSDDTIQIVEALPENSGSDSSPIFLRRTKLPKRFEGLPGPGTDVPFIVLNVLGDDCASARLLADPLDCGRAVIEYYGEKDLTIGGVLNCFGRKIVLTDCDPATKEYYRKKYGVDDFTPLPKPKDKCEGVTVSVKLKDRELPPWNGFGTHEDSAQNCVTVDMKPPVKDFKKFIKYDRSGMDSHILRFEAKMLSKIKENCTRHFIISYFLADNTISVMEIAKRNSGFQTSVFFKREEIKMPGQPTFTSKPPLLYQPHHMFVGATLIINSFTFILIGADEYALRYMELHPEQFPKSDLCLIMNKIREKVRPIYKEFIAEFIPGETGTIEYGKLREKLCSLLKEDFTEQEMITVSRGFSATCVKDKYDREYIRAIALTELKRHLWDDLDRLREYFIKRDKPRSGKLSKHDCYTLLKGCRLPFDQELINKIFQVIKKDEDCNIFYDDLLNFLDRDICKMTDVPPVNIKYELSWLSEKEPEFAYLIDWCAFNKCLNLNEAFANVPVPGKDV